jgi:periplasmic protein TonB
MLFVVVCVAIGFAITKIPKHSVFEERMEIVYEEPPKQSPPSEPPKIPHPPPDPSPALEPLEHSPPPVFGLLEEATSETGDMETATGNTLMTTPDSIVKPNSGPLPAVQAVDYETPYLENLRKAIASHYPLRARKFRLEGTVRLHLLLEKTGRIAEASLLIGSGHEALDQGVLNWLQQQGAFDPFPTGLNRETWELEIPVVFKLR